MTQLRDVASLIRSKNAGPFHFTFDIFIEDPETYEVMKAENAITAATFEAIYGVDEANITFIEYDEAAAFKATLPRPHSSGSPKDRDMMGGQQHAPLVTLEIDLPE